MKILFQKYIFRSQTFPSKRLKILNKGMTQKNTSAVNLPFFFSNYHHRCAEKWVLLNETALAPRRCRRVFCVRHCAGRSPIDRGCFTCPGQRRVLPFPRSMLGSTSLFSLMVTPSHVWPRASQNVHDCFDCSFFARLGDASRTAGPARPHTPAFLAEQRGQCLRTCGPHRTCRLG